MRISGKTQQCLIIGDPVEHSLSPAMHNAAYTALGIDDQYVFTAAHVVPADLATVVSAVRAMKIRGLTCTIPHKVDIMQYLDEIDETAKQIGAVNTVVNNNGVLTGYNTDCIGVSKALSNVTHLAGKKVALMGAGGAAKAMAYAVMNEGALLTVYNRSIDKAEELVKEMGGTAKTLEDLSDLAHMDIIMNSTSLGMGEQVNETPVPDRYLHTGQIVFDAVYVPHVTRLLREAKAKGATIVHGLDMLLYQGMAQFELYTGQKAPEAAMGAVLMEHI